MLHLSPYLNTLLVRQVTDTDTDTDTHPGDDVHSAGPQLLLHDEFLLPLLIQITGVGVRQRRHPVQPHTEQLSNCETERQQEYKL